MTVKLDTSEVNRDYIHQNKKAIGIYSRWLLFLTEYIFKQLKNTNMKTSLKSEVKSLESAINDVNSKLLANYSVNLINIRQRLEWRLAAKSQKLINEKPKC